MRISARGRTGLSAMVALAARGSEQPVALADLARSERLSLAHLEQLFCALRRAGLVRSTRGPGGGYRLARAAHRIAVADVLKAVDEPVGQPPADDGCRAGDLWCELGQHIGLFLNAVTLAEVVEGRVTGRASAPASLERVPG